MANSYLFLLTDQSQDPAQFLKSLLNAPGNVRALDELLDASASALIQEVHELTPAEREIIGKFKSIEDLVMNHEQSEEKTVIFPTVLLCIAHVAALVLRVNQNPNLLNDRPEHHYLLGLCTGFLPAVVLAASKTKQDVIDLGSRITCVAFRLAVEVHRRSRRIENRAGSWATVVRGIPKEELQKALDGFQSFNNVPPHRQPYISAESPNSFTISAPPSTLEQLVLQSQKLREAQRLSLPIYGAFHASHLASPSIEYISKPVLDRHIELRLNTAIISASSGDIYTGRSVGIVIFQGLHDILQSPICQSTMIGRTTSHLENTSTSLLVIEPTAGTSGICQMLASAGITAPQKSEPPRKDCASDPEDDPIAIVAMSGRFPGGENLDEFWTSLEEGKSLHKPIPPERFDASRYFDAYGKSGGTSPAPHGCFVDCVGDFDTSLFSISAREAKQTDPTQRLLMMTSYEALEMAGYSRDYEGTVGTFFGQTTDDWREANAGQSPDIYYVPGTIRAFGPGRLNYFFKWEGPSYSIDTACSSSLAAIELACQSLQLGNCDMAIAGGGNVLTGPNMFRGLSKGGFLSPTGSCKTFDNEADGYCRGEGVGVVILKSLSKAIADKDNVYGIIRGIATNHSAHAISITHPHQGAQEQLFRQTLRHAGVSPSLVDYVELHGTGTQAGDRIEVASVANAFSDMSKPDSPLYIGSVKANMGHGEAAAGITSMIKALLMFRKSRIPPHAGIKKEINQNISYISDMNIRIPNSSLPFTSRSGEKQRRILVNNFNATGGNTSLLLEEFVPLDQAEPCSVSHYPVVLSAKTAHSLQKSKARLVKYLGQNRETVRLPDLSYTTTARRLHHPFRESYSAADVGDLIQQMSFESGAEAVRIDPQDQQQTVFTFTGQGANHRRMAKELCETCVVFREFLTCYNEIAMRFGFPSFLQYLTDDTESDDAPLSPMVQQLSHVALEIAMAELWKALGIHPSLVIGHSLGEYPALCIAGALSVSDTLFLVGKRAQIMEAMCTMNSHAMLIVSLPLQSAQEYCARYNSCEVACMNGPSVTVIAGPQEQIKQLEGSLAGEGIQTKYLALPYAFHSSQMDPILEPLQELIQSVPFSNPNVSILSSLMGDVIHAGTTIAPDYLVHHVREPVDILGALGAGQQAGVYNDKTLWLECGPGPGCLGMIKNCIEVAPSKLVLSMKTGISNWKTMSTALASFYRQGHDIVWFTIQRDNSQNLQLLELPPYGFDTQRYWIDLVDDRKPEATGPVKAKRQFLGTCVQYLESQDVDSQGTATMTFVSDGKQQQLLTAIEGHCVKGHNLCPSSVYVDMAVTSARYLYRERGKVDAGPGVELGKIDISRPLVVSGNGPDTEIKIKSTLHQGSDTINITVGSKQGKDADVEHSHCEVQFTDSEQWQTEWARYSDFVISKIDQLVKPENGRDICRIPKKIIYQMFAEIVDYNDKYHSISEIFIDCDRTEACGTIQLPGPTEHGQFSCSPYCVDGIVHFAGFLLNNNLGRVKDTAYVSSGWESLRLLQDRLVAKPYRIYSRMQESKKKGLWVGDVYLLDGDEIVATCFGLKFQKIKISLLEQLLGGSMSAGHDEPVPQDKPSPSRETPKARPLSATDSPPPVDSLSDVIKIIAEEVGMDVSEIAEDARFEDLGVDSLLSVSITSSIVSKLGLALPTGLFSGDSSVSQFRGYFQKETSCSQAFCTDASSALSVRGPTPSSTTTVSEEGSIFEQFLTAVVTETGCQVADLQPHARFEDLGVDSLLSMTILVAFQEATGRRLASSVFNDQPTVQAMRDLLVGPVSQPSQPDDSQSMSPEPWPEYSNHGQLLQGNPASGLPPLFLIAPGSGHPGPYFKLPKFPSGLPVYALESPFLRGIPAGGWTMEQAASLYIREMRRFQPRGPYILGGWSIGGMYSYEVSRQLLSAGEEVLGIIMIDSPCPKGSPNMPAPTIEAVEITGLYCPIQRPGLPDIDMPPSMKQHTIGSLNALKNYVPNPLEGTRKPRLVTQIWASQGEYDQVPERVREATELLEAKKNGQIPALQPLTVSRDWQRKPRASFGPCGWDRLVGELECHVVEGDHESIMSPPQIAITGALVRDAIERILAMVK